MADILSEIRPCDSDRPYIFISYSSEDREVVWQDVYEFQRRGYNVWLDEKNLDKRKDSWKQDALSAIKDMDCWLLVFYVSKASLCSSYCYQELKKMREEETCMWHEGEPVEFIAVDVEEIGDITCFKKDMLHKIRIATECSKEERKKRMQALQGIVSDFFNDSNEKVRIPPKNQKNRKMDYYEEITATFPEVTRLSGFGGQNTDPEQLFEILRTLRLAIANEEGVAAYRIFKNATLQEMCRVRPVTKKEMLKIYGVGEYKYEKYGERFLEALQKYADKK